MGENEAKEQIQDIKKKGGVYYQNTKSKGEKRQVKERQLKLVKELF